MTLAPLQLTTIRPSMFPSQASTIPLQTTTTTQFDMTEIFNMMFPMMMLVMMMGVMGKAMAGNEEQTEAE